MLNHRLPMSLVRRQSLLNILDNVGLEQWPVTDGLTSAIPIDEFLAYYEWKLLRDILVVEQGLILRIAISLRTKQSAFTVFRALAVPMPQPGNDTAINWKLEAPYSALFRKQR